MKLTPLVRCAVLLLAVFLLADASWCCAVDTDSHIDCHECICSGQALVVSCAPAVPHFDSSPVETGVTSARGTYVASVEVPPHERG